MKKNFDDKELETFKTLVTATQAQLHIALNKHFANLYGEENVYPHEEFTYIVGDIPVILVAHMDTVFKYTPEEIYYDKSAHVIWSPDGLGADDRAGIFAILKITSKGLRPHIIFTRDEEKGALGACSFTYTYPQIPIEGVKFIVQLDRQGRNDCVFYRCDNKDFINFIESYDFETKRGSFSDISYLCPDWGIAGVNLSIGYFYEHSEVEILRTDFLFRTIEQTIKILEDAISDNIPTFKYIPIKETKNVQTYSSRF